MLLKHRKIKEISRQHFDAIQAYVAEKMAEENVCCPANLTKSASQRHEEASQRPAPPASNLTGAAEKSPKPVRKESAAAFGSFYACEDAVLSGGEETLESYLRQVRDESFSEMLLRKIDEKGWKDSTCYKKANVDKRLFSKIRSNPQYKPSKSTALALILALELPLNEANEMLRKAGFAFSHASKADLIVEYYIGQGIYDLFVINDSLFTFDQPLIGNFK